MKIELEKVNLNRFIEHSDTVESPLHRLSIPKTTTYGVYIHRETPKLYFCICGATEFKKNGVNKSGNQRYKCISCGSSRVLSINVFNTDLAFNTLYDEKFTESCMQRTKHQKIESFRNDRKTHTFFNACIQQLTLDQLATEEILELAFYMTCRYIEDESWKLVNKTYDDWYFLQNYSNSDVQYRLQDFIVPMIRTHNIKGSSAQDSKIPLLFVQSVTVSAFNVTTSTITADAL